MVGTEPGFCLRVDHRVAAAGRAYAARSASCCFCWSHSLVMWNSATPSAMFPIRAMAQIGQAFYIAVAGTQLALVMLAAPAATAGAICLDRARAR